MAVYTDAIQKLYVAYFSRPADVSGLQYWDEVIFKANGSSAEVAAAFAASSEYKTLFDGLDEYGIVDLIYHNLFGRAAEQAGLEYWGDGLKQNRVTVADVVTTIARAAQGTDQTAFTNKVTASTAFTNALDTAFEVLTYTGESANGVLQEWLLGITTDASLKASLDGLDAFIDDLTHGGVIIDAGGGDDVLALTIVGDANAGSFKNFELFDVAGLDTAFDQSILNANNKVKSFIASSALDGDAAIDNLGAGVSFVVKGHMGTVYTLTLNQETAGPLTIVSNVDETRADESEDTSAASVIASNATALNITFDNANADKLEDGFANEARLTVEATAAETLAIVSGGTQVVNVLDYTAGEADSGAVLASVSITGRQHLVFNYDSAGTLNLASVDASGQTAGGLSFNLEDLATPGTLKLGAGDDVMTATVMDTSAVSSSGVQNIVGLEKASGEDEATIGGFDVISFDGAIQAADVAATTGTGAHSIKNGVYTFIGSGTTTLAAAVARIAGDIGVNEVVVFTFGTNKYIYGAGATAGLFDDLLVKVTGTADIHGLDVVGSGNIFLF